MKTSRFGLNILIVALLAFGTVSGAKATICDDDPAAIAYTPTVSSPQFLNGVLDLLGEIQLVDFNVTVPFSQDFEHTINVVMDSTINMAGLDFVVSVWHGSIDIELNLPAWAADMDITVEHAPCRDCIAEWSACDEPCEPEYDACVAPCVPNYNACVAPCVPNYNACVAGCVAGPLYDFCLDACTTARDLCQNVCNVNRDLCHSGCVLTRDVCHNECNIGQAGCNLENVVCFFERDLLDNLLAGQAIGMSFDDSIISQTADVCVTGNCEAVHPLESTAVNLENFHVEYFPEGDDLGFGYWLNTLVTGMVNDMVSPSETIRSLLVDAETGEGVLVGAFSNEIKNDGCVPVQPLADCQGAACSTTTTPNVRARQSASILLYSLPLLVMSGLIFWGRRR